MTKPDLGIRNSDAWAHADQVVRAFLEKPAHTATDLQCTAEELSMSLKEVRRIEALRAWRNSVRASRGN